MNAPIAVFNSLDEARAKFGPCALTIGNFDGVHLGHQELFREVALLSTRHKWTPAALTFNPHPAYIVAPARAPKRIASLEDRIAAMAFCGIEKVLVLPFTHELSQLSPGDFVRQILHQTLDARAVVVTQGDGTAKGAVGGCSRGAEGSSGPTLAAKPEI